MLRLCVVVACAGCGRLGFEGAGDMADASIDATMDTSQSAWWDTAWQHRRKLVFRNSAHAEDLVGFQALVELDATRIDFAAAQPGGQDLRFVDADGVTVLEHEIEGWTMGSAQVWIRVPQIDASSTTDHVWMYYGNATAPDAQDRDAVWAEYHGVWHLAEQGNGTAGELVDSSPQRKHATAGAAPRTPMQAPGRIGSAQRFDGNDDVISLTAAQSASFNFTTPRLTIEAWVNLAASRPDHNNPITFDGFSRGYRIGVSAANKMGFQITGMTYDCDSQTLMVPQLWHYIVGTYDGATMRIHINGVKDPSERLRPGNLDPTTSPVLIGRSGTSMTATDYPVLGSIDEPRIANIARSSVWIMAQYRSMTDAFITYGVE